MQGAPESKARLAVFDFDGTSIAGNSPVLLVSHLLSRKMLKKRVVFRILLWAAAYKLRLPQNEAAVRGLVFTAFEGKPAAEVDAFLAEFYDERIAPLFRPEADAAMRAHAEAGDTVVVISATFEPIILRAMEHHPFDNQISTRMSVATDGTYTRAVEGLPVEGEEKLAAVRRFGDSRVARSAARPHRARKGLGDPRLVEPCAHTLRVAYVLGFLRFDLCGGFLLG